MAFTAQDVKALREKTGVGMMECKKALVEADGDMDKAVDFLRERGLAAAAKKATRIAAEGVVLPYYDAEAKKGVVVEVNSETDFVAKNEKFMSFVEGVAKTILATNPADVEALKEEKFDGTDRTVTETLNDLVLSIGENMKVRRFERMDGIVSTYIHGGGSVGVMVGFDVADESKAATAEFDAMGKNVAMQIAAMNPIAIDEAGVPESVKEAEIQVAIDKTKKEQVDKAVEVALKKAGINPAHVDSEEHMESNKAKGWITDEDIAKAKEIIATVSAEKAANLPQQMIENIAKGRLGKFLKEVCLLNQEDIMDGKKTVREVLKEADPELQIVAFKRFTLRAE